MTYQQWLQSTTNSYNNQWGEQRLGQFFMNSLFPIREDLYRSVSSPSNRLENRDPFYDDKNFPNFLVFLMNNWAN